MTKRKVKNLPASIRQRLLEVAQRSNRPFQEVLQYYGMERFLYRLSVSRHSDKFVLKGALMLVAWRATTTRPTRDIDLLGHLPNRQDLLIEVIRDTCTQEVEPDAIVFDIGTIQAVPIREDSAYQGTRISFRGMLQNIPIPMQIDVGFGDIVFPASTIATYPTVLDHATPILHGYSKESVIAEKFETMVKFGLLNSRMKDFFDVWLLSQLYGFDGRQLAEAISRTFRNRATDLTPRPSAFTEEFAIDPVKAAQWRGFVRKIRVNQDLDNFASVCRAISLFLAPVATALYDEKTFRGSWPPTGPWNMSGK